MDAKKLGSDEPAFPALLPEHLKDQYFYPGISKRFYAACAAMNGMLANSNFVDINSIESLCKAAYVTADELLKQENQ